MCIFFCFFFLSENLASNKAFSIYSEFDLSVRSREKKISSDFRLSLGVSSKWKGEQGAVDASMHSSAGRLPSNEMEMCHRGKGDGEDEQKCGQRIQEDEGRHCNCLTSSLFLILSCNGVCKYRLCKASQFVYTGPWRQKGWRKPGVWPNRQRISLSVVPCISKRGQSVRMNIKAHVFHWQRGSHSTNKSCCNIHGVKKILVRFNFKKVHSP